ncbi:DUF1285 domain-containing protein [Kaustia mangrovi]|uniref:DUF1285 domain-containing protein n=1 Tax=Kaustia mangrovi TaxID=2593653 RepID=A0A7S8C6F2_9HYPH|nr:DUF1285 domain-containing protein [Kaustia mangrovi]
MTVSQSDRTATVPQDEPPQPVRGLDKAGQSLPDPGGARPVDEWNPPFSGDIDMVIARDGSWLYRGTPILRDRLVRLFASILRRDGDGDYYLVTPVEKCRIAVEDAPFVAVAMEAEGTGRGQILRFVTNVGDRVRADGDHPLRFAEAGDGQGPKPYVLVRGRLEALVARAVFYDMVDLAAVEETGEGRRFGLWSAGIFFPMAREEDITP